MSTTTDTPHVEELYFTDYVGWCSVVFVEYTRGPDQIIRLLRVYAGRRQITALSREFRQKILLCLAALPRSVG